MKKFISLLLCLALLLTAAGCGVTTPEAQGGIQEGDIIRIVHHDLAVADIQLLHQAE